MSIILIPLHVLFIQNEKNPHAGMRNPTGIPHSTLVHAPSNFPGAMKTDKGFMVQKEHM